MTAPSPPTRDETLALLLRARDLLDAAEVPSDGRLIWPFDYEMLSVPHEQESAMTDPAPGYPVAANPVPAVPAVQAVPLTPAEQEQVDMLYDELKPAATESARAYVLARTPASLQVAMNEKIDADWPAPEPPTEDVLAARREDAMSGFRTASVTLSQTAPVADPPVGQTYPAQFQPLR